jgi:hypothetical protein
MSSDIPEILGTHHDHDLAHVGAQFSYQQNGSDYSDPTAPAQTKGEGDPAIAMLDVLVRTADRIELLGLGLSSPYSGRFFQHYLIARLDDLLSSFSATANENASPSTLRL